MDTMDSSGEQCLPGYEGDAVILTAHHVRRRCSQQQQVMEDEDENTTTPSAVAAPPAPQPPPPPPPAAAAAGGGGGSVKHTHVYCNVTVHYSVSFKRLCMVTVACPFLALVICFVTAYIFQYDDIHETHCRVYNIVPSISAITGVSPQRYLWRASVALHIGPRYIIAAVYRAYQQNAIDNSADHQVKSKANLWLDITFWLNVIEVSALGGVTYISNLENYPVHEKLFIVFMVTSLCHMAACIKAVQMVAVSNDDVVAANKELFYKKFLFGLSIACTVGMIVFFLKHRLLCHNMAFSWFAICEYVVATANMAFHLTLVCNFPSEQMVVARGLHLHDATDAVAAVAAAAAAPVCDAGASPSSTASVAAAKHKPIDLKID